MLQVGCRPCASGPTRQAVRAPKWQGCVAPARARHAACNARAADPPQPSALTPTACATASRTCVRCLMITPGMRAMSMIWMMGAPIAMGCCKYGAGA